MSSKFGDTGGGRGGRGKKRKLQEQQQRAARALAIERPVLLPQSAVYTRLLDFEREVDAQLARKKAEVNEALKRVDRETRTLRVYVYNTFKPATASAVSETPHGEKTEVDPASWTLHVQGRLLEPGEPGTVEKNAGTPRPTTDGTVTDAPKFGGFLKRLVVKIHANADDKDGSEHTWDAYLADPRAALPDGFEIKRVGEADARLLPAVALRAALVPDDAVRRRGHGEHANVRAVPSDAPEAKTIGYIFFYVHGSLVE